MSFRSFLPAVVATLLLFVSAAMVPASLLAHDREIVIGLSKSSGNIFASGVPGESFNADGYSVSFISPMSDGWLEREPFWGFGVDFSKLSSNEILYSSVSFMGHFVSPALPLVPNSWIHARAGIGAETTDFARGRERLLGSSSNYTFKIGFGFLAGWDDFKFSLDTTIQEHSELTEIGLLLFW